MDMYSKSARLLRITLQREMRNPLINIVYLMVILLIFNTFSGVAIWLADNNDKLNIFELYIMFGESDYTHVIYVLGIVLLACGRTVYNRSSMYYLMRMDKKSWIYGNVMYIILTSVIYNIIILYVLILLCRGYITLDGSWSNALYEACVKDPMAINIDGVVQASSFRLFFPYNPNVVGIIKLILMVLEGIICGMIMMIFTMKNRAYYGIAIIFASQFCQLLINAEFGKKKLIAKIWNTVVPVRYFWMSELFNNGLDMEVLLSIVYLIMVLMFLMYIIRRINVEYDFWKDE